MAGGSSESTKTNRENARIYASVLQGLTCNFRGTLLKSSYTAKTRHAARYCREKTGFSVGKVKRPAATRRGAVVAREGAARAAQAPRGPQRAKLGRLVAAAFPSVSALAESTPVDRHAGVDLKNQHEAGPRHPRARRRARGRLRPPRSRRPPPRRGAADARASGADCSSARKAEPGSVKLRSCAPELSTDLDPASVSIYR